MAFIESTMVELGTKAPAFSLPDTVSGKELTLEALTKGAKATVIMFLCNHCPYVIHVNPEIVRITQDYKDQAVSFIGISSNDAINYPQDGPEKMKTHAAVTGYTFPYLYDESQAVAKAYDAACTPDFYVFDENLALVYRGRIDDARPSTEKALTGRDLRQAIEATLQGAQVNSKQYPSGGCNIKWKK